MELKITNKESDDSQIVNKQTNFVKIFKGNPNQKILEKNINKWFESNPNIEITHTTQTMSHLYDNIVVTIFYKVI